MNDVDDVTLARALIARDPEAREVVWRRFRPMVARAAARFFDSPADIDDVVQEVFVCLLNRVHTLTHPAALRNFILSITRFTITYQRKRAMRRRYEPLADHHAESVTVSLDAESRETLGRVFHRLERSATIDRAAFMLRFVHGLEILEVASALGRSPATVKRHLARTRRRVLARLGTADATA